MPGLGPSRLALPVVVVVVVGAARLIGALATLSGRGVFNFSYFGTGRLELGVALELVLVDAVHAVVEAGMVFAAALAACTGPHCPMLFNLFQPSVWPYALAYATCYCARLRWCLGWCTGMLARHRFCEV